MTFEQLVNLIVNNGIGVVCIVYFIIRDYKFMDTLNDTLSSLKDSVQLIQKYFIEKQDKEEK